LRHVCRDAGSFGEGEVDIGGVLAVDRVDEPVFGFDGVEVGDETAQGGLGLALLGRACGDGADKVARAVVGGTCCGRERL
jgi:hypothetical protein